MKKENFSNSTGSSITVASTVNFVVGVFKNGQRLDDENGDFTRSGSAFTFIEALSNDDVVIVYF